MLGINKMEIDEKKSKVKIFQELRKRLFKLMYRTYESYSEGNAIVLICFMMQTIQLTFFPLRRAVSFLPRGIFIILVPSIMVARRLLPCLSLYLLRDQSSCLRRPMVQLHLHLCCFFGLRLSYCRLGTSRSNLQIPEK